MEGTFGLSTRFFPTVLHTVGGDYSQDACSPRRSATCLKLTTLPLFPLSLYCHSRCFMSSTLALLVMLRGPPGSWAFSTGRPTSTPVQATSPESIHASEPSTDNKGMGMSRTAPSPSPTSSSVTQKDSERTYGPVSMWLGSAYPTPAPTIPLIFSETPSPSAAGAPFRRGMIMFL